MSLPFPCVLAESTSFWSLVSSSVRASSAIENAILLFLVVCSIVSWAIVAWKLKAIRAARAGNEKVASALEGTRNIAGLVGGLEQMGTAPNVRICAAAIDELKRASGDSPITQMGRVQMKMNHTSRNESAKLHRGMNILASIASATPFIGLFGTVLGIMHTFQVLGTAKSASLNVVAPGIAAALIATAAGLAVAIPAVFLYNALMARMDELQDQADMFVETLGQRLSAGEAMGPPPTTRAFERHVTEPVIIGEGAHVPGATL